MYKVRGERQEVIFMVSRIINHLVDDNHPRSGRFARNDNSSIVERNAVSLKGQTLCSITKIIVPAIQPN